MRRIEERAAEIASLFRRVRDPEAWAIALRRAALVLEERDRRHGGAHARPVELRRLGLEAEGGEVGPVAHRSHVAEPDSDV
ncbi:MAG: hypothetical protein HY721_26895 [Planctomycetes bacterium]|nr:hypothetical protein [Planctomycetota bacterium]